MDVSRTAIEGNRAAEIERQAMRVQEQSVNLDNMLSVIMDHLTDMTKIMGDYGGDIVVNIKALNEALSDYQVVAKRIYNDVSTKMLKYSSGLKYNVETLGSNVNKISGLIKELGSSESATTGTSTTSTEGFDRWT